MRHPRNKYAHARAHARAQMALGSSAVPVAVKMMWCIDITVDDIQMFAHEVRMLKVWATTLCRAAPRRAELRYAALRRAMPHTPDLDLPRAPVDAVVPPHSRGYVRHFHHAPGPMHCDGALRDGLITGPFER